MHCRFLKWIYQRVNQFLNKIEILSNISIESLLNLNWSDLDWFRHFNIVLSEETALAYFCQKGNPFYDRSSLNEQIYTKNLPAEAMVR